MQKFIPLSLADNTLAWNLTLFFSIMFELNCARMLTQARRRLFDKINLLFFLSCRISFIWSAKLLFLPSLTSFLALDNYLLPNFLVDSKVTPKSEHVMVKHRAIWKVRESELSTLTAMHSVFDYLTKMVLWCRVLYSFTCSDLIHAALTLMTFIFKHHAYFTLKKTLSDFVY